MDEIKCVLTEPTNEVEGILRELFISCGEKITGNHAGYNAYNAYPTGGVQYLVDNIDDDKKGTPYKIPQWALSLSIKIKRIVWDAECIGREAGYENGLADGKSFVVQLASGDMAMNDFNKADGRDSRRLNKRKWDE